jgi:hypothetical protein
VCAVGIHDRTWYLSSLRILDDLDRVAGTLSRLCELGFRLVQELCIGTGGLCSVEREKLEAGNSDLLTAFRKAWIEAHAEADFSSIRPIGAASWHGQLPTVT